MKQHPSRDLALIKAAGFLRSFGVGTLGVLLGIYLDRCGLSSFEIGLVIAAGWAGSASSTVVTSLGGDRLGRRRFLVSLSLLSVLGGIGLAATPSLYALVIMAFVGMLNGTGTDRSAAFALDQAVIPGLAAHNRRTWNLALYNLFLDGGGSLGALGAGLPTFLQSREVFSAFNSYRVVFLGYSGLCLMVAALYSCLSPAVEVVSAGGAASILARISPGGRKVIANLTALFSLAG